VWNEWPRNEPIPGIPGSFGTLSGPVPSTTNRAVIRSPRLVSTTQHARFAQPRPGDQPGEPAADAHHRAVIGLRRPRGPRRGGIVEVVRELAGQADVLGVAVRAQPLVPLAGVLAAQRAGIDARGPRRAVGRRQCRLRRTGSVTGARRRRPMVPSWHSSARTR